MSSKPPERDLFGILRRIQEWLALVLALLAAIGAVATALTTFAKGNPGVATVIAIAVFGIILAASLLYIRFKKAPPIDSNLITVPGTTDSVVRYAYPRRLRSAALAGLIAFPLLGLSGLGIWKCRHRPSNEVVILVTRFDGPDAQNYRVTDTIMENLREATHQYTEVKVDGLNDSVTEAEGSDKARSLGRRNGASIVLWGWYGRTGQSAEVSVHFEILSALKTLMPAPENRFSGTRSQLLTSAVAELDSFHLQIELSSETSYLALLTAGLARYESNDYSGAIVRLNDAMDKLAKSKDPFGSAYLCYFCRGAAFELLGDYDRAIPDFDKVVTLMPDYWNANYNRGLAYYYKKEYDRAIADFDRVISLKPKDVEAYNNRANAYDDKGEFAKAIADYEKAIGFKPDFADAYYNRGIAYNEKGEYDKAIADYDKAISLKPDYAEAYNNRGAAYHRKNEYDKAIADYDKAIRLKPDYADAYNNRGAVHDGKGDYDKAIADYSRAISLKPDYAEAYNNRGLAYDEKREYDKAIADLDKAISLKPDDPDTYTGRGLAYYYKKEYDKAIADYDMAIHLKPDDADAYDNRGSAHDERGDHDKAIADFDKAISLKPNFGEAYYGRGIAKEKKGDRAGALHDFKQALGLDSSPEDKVDAEKHIKELSGN